MANDSSAFAFAQDYLIRQGKVNTSSRIQVVMEETERTKRAKRITWATPSRKLRDCRFTVMHVDFCKCASAILVRFSFTERSQGGRTEVSFIAGLKKTITTGINPDFLSSY